MSKHFDKQYKGYQNKVELHLGSICEGTTSMPTVLSNGIKYAVMGGGKRLRPVLFLATTKMLGGTIGNKTVRLACVLELIHSYSLVHDDLPCMDDDDIRRGKPTVHKVFGEAIAVLIGDALLNLAYEIGLGLIDNTAKGKGHRQAMECIASNASGVGMIGGQTMDILLDDNKDSSKLEYIYLCKTAALFCASLVAAARAADAKESVVKLLDTLGVAMGVAFQIKDDLDEFYNGQYSDKSKDKITIVSVYGDSRAKELLYEQLDNCRNSLYSLRGLGLDTGFLDECVARLAIK